MRRSTEELWEAAGLGVYQDMSLCDSAGVEHFAAAIRADEAEHTRHDCVETAERILAKWNTSDSVRDDMRSAMISAGKAPVLKPGMLVQWDGSVTGGRYIQEWSPDDDERFGDKERATLRPLTKAEILSYADKAPE